DRDTLQAAVAQERAQLRAIMDGDHLAAALVPQHKLERADLAGCVVVDRPLDHRRFQPPAGVDLAKQPIKSISGLLRHERCSFAMTLARRVNDTTCAAISGAVAPPPRSPHFGGAGYPLGVPPNLPANADCVSRVNDVSSV